MTREGLSELAPEDARRKLAVFSGGFLKDQRIRRILTLAGWHVQVGILPRQTEAVAVWGRKPVSKRGLRAAQKRGLPVLTVEDAFLRSVKPGVEGQPALGLFLDLEGVHFDCSGPSRLERLLADHPLDDPDLSRRASEGIAFLRKHKLSKYNAFRGGDLPEPGYVLVIDQTRADASITFGGAGRRSFGRMLEAARVENPGKRILIRTHPVAASGHRRGHFDESDLDERTAFLDPNINPWDALDGAGRVYTVTSQLGFEAILAGHRPEVFGLPFYSGWGLSRDRQQIERRGRALTREQLFAAVMLIYAVWYDPAADALTDFETAARTLAAQTRAWREDNKTTVCVGMRAWKQKSVSRFLGNAMAVQFIDDPARAVETAAAGQGRVVVWAGRESEALREACRLRSVPLVRMEDGFLRSVGLGAELRPASSLVLDDLGIYFDPTRPSRLEALIEQSVKLDSADLRRAERLIDNLTAHQVTKYNLEGAMPDLAPRPGQKVVLVPGQVEDDASIRLGADRLATNLDLLTAVRQACPDAYLIYKPHPDVEAGLRVGEVPSGALTQYADLVARRSAAGPLMDAVDEIWTMTSLLGFEALLRGKTIHCLGTPFYAGWGLTQDHGPRIERRQARPSLAALVHACLIDHPRYLDPATGDACPVEAVLATLARRDPRAAGRDAWGLRLLARVQHRLRRYSGLWR